jgi:hypothetical protein
MDRHKLHRWTVSFGLKMKLNRVIPEMVMEMFK